MRLPKSNLFRAFLFEGFLVWMGFIWNEMNGSFFGFWFGWLIYTLILHVLCEVMVLSGFARDLIDDGH